MNASQFVRVLSEFAKDSVPDLEDVALRLDEVSKSVSQEIMKNHGFDTEEQLNAYMMLKEKTVNFEDVKEPHDVITQLLADEKAEDKEEFIALLNRLSEALTKVLTGDTATETDFWKSLF